MTRAELNEKKAFIDQQLEALSAIIKPVAEDEATEADYLNALEELGVDTSEEG